MRATVLCMERSVDSNAACFSIKEQERLDLILIKSRHFYGDFMLHFLDRIKHIGHRAISIPLGK